MTELSAAIPRLVKRDVRVDAARPVERDLSHVPPDASLSAPFDLDLDAVTVAMQAARRRAGARVCGV